MGEPPKSISQVTCMCWSGILRFCYGCMSFSLLLLLVHCQHGIEDYALGVAIVSCHWLFSLLMVYSRTMVVFVSSTTRGHCYHMDCLGSFGHHQKERSIYTVCVTRIKLFCKSYSNCCCCVYSSLRVYNSCLVPYLFCLLYIQFLIT